MANITVIKTKKDFNIEISTIASDKSISHRCAIFSMLSDKQSIIKNYLQAEDTLNSLEIIKALGAKIEVDGNTTYITPPKKIQEPKNVLDCGNSGTGMRLFCGYLSSQNGSFVLVGDKYLHSRPMKRITEPLKSIGASLDGREEGNYAPLHIRGGKINHFKYESNIASAQVKSAMILAALSSDDVCVYSEPELSRDHTERMLKGLGVNIQNQNNTIIINPITQKLEPLNITVPSDPSSGFFFAVAAAIHPGSSITIKNTSLNPTRIEAYKVLEKMGAEIEYTLHEEKYEPIGDIKIIGRSLKAVTVSENISWLIDELPALSIAFACSEGVSVVRNAEELRVKESDRIKSVVDNLNLCGIKTNEFEDGYEVIGGTIKSAKINSHGDHRIAMSFAIAGLKADMQIDDVDCINTSFPNFIELLSKVSEVENES